jgi:hypothetical protein
VAIDRGLPRDPDAVNTTDVEPRLLVLVPDESEAAPGPSVRAGIRRTRQPFVAPSITRRRPSVSWAASVAVSGLNSHWTMSPWSRVW